MTRDFLTARELDTVARKLIPHVARIVELAPGLKSKGAELADTLPLYVPRPGFEVDTGAPLLKRKLSHVGWWHQVAEGGGPPVAFARSERSNGRLELHTAGVSRLVNLIDDALGRLEAGSADADPPRLVVVPFAYAHFLWVTERGQDRLVPVETPELPYPVQFEPERVLTPGEFMATAAAILEARNRAATELEAKAGRVIP